MLSGCSSPDGLPTYPRRPIKLVVPFVPGGGTDTFARIIKKAIEDHELLPQPIVIVNVAGAGATIGSRRVKNAPADGYTLLILHEALITAQLAGRAAYGPEAFAPIAGTGELGLVVAVREDASYQNLSDLLEATRTADEPLVFSANLGAPVHFVGLRLEQYADGGTFRFTQSGGGTNRLHAIKGGHAHVTAFSIEEFLRYQAAGLRAIAYCDTTRHPSIPDVATTHEQGIPLTHINMQFWWAPRNTPVERLTVIADALQAAMKTETVRSRMERIHCQPTFARGESMRAEVDARRESLAQVAMRSEIQPPRIEWFVVPLTIVCGAAALVQTRRYCTGNSEHVQRNDTSAGDNSSPEQKQSIVVLAFAAATIGYVFALSLHAVDFRVATFVYVTLVGHLLSTKPRIIAPMVFAVALAVSIGLHFVFVQCLGFMLP